MQTAGFEEGLVPECMQALERRAERRAGGRQRGIVFDLNDVYRPSGKQGRRAALHVPISAFDVRP